MENLAKPLGVSQYYEKFGQVQLDVFKNILYIYKYISMFKKDTNIYMNKYIYI